MRKFDIEPVLLSNQSLVYIQFLSVVLVMFFVALFLLLMGIKYQHPWSTSLTPPVLSGSPPPFGDRTGEKYTGPGEKHPRLLHLS